jgi:hypothetical protein
LGSGLSSDRKEQIFNYELLHAIYFEAVDLVKRIGAVLYQVLMIIDLDCFNILNLIYRIKRPLEES